MFTAVPSARLLLHFSYWGFNQYIIQRSLGAKSIREAQKGLAFAAVLKLLMPLIIVLPGIAAALLVTPEISAIDGATLAERPDRAYPEVIKIMPEGLRGLIFAALIAAIISSLASMMNSIATIFTLDIYRAMKPDLSEQAYVRIGRASAAVAVILATFLAQPLLGSLESAFQTLQQYTGFIAPGVVAVFLMGMFWKQTTSRAAIVMLVMSVAANIGLKFLAPDLAFVIRIWLVFLACLVSAVVVSKLENKGDDSRAVDLSAVDFSTSSVFNMMAFAVVVVLITLYVVFW